MVADSRATWQRTTGQVAPALYQDTLQKILPLGPRTAIGYAGDVQAAALVIREIRRRMRAKPRLHILGKLAAEIPRLAKHYHQVHTGRTGRSIDVALVLGGVTASGLVRVWWYTSPDFAGHELGDRFKVLGSGSVIVPQIAAAYSTLGGLANLKDRTDTVVRALDEGLSRAGVPTVGGLFQVIALTREGIRPLRYGFMNVDPQGSAAPARGMEMVAGRWVQTDLATGKEVPLTEPTGLLSRTPTDIRVHDYAQRANPPLVLRWYLTRFIVCFSVQRNAGSTEFLGVFTALAADTYPQQLTFIAAVSFWGPVGQHEVEFVLARDERQQLHKEVINVPYAVEEVLVERNLTASIAGPGPAFLEFHIAGQMLGRRALYFGEVTTPPLTDEAELREIASRVNDTLLEQQRACSDPVIEESGEPRLVYLSLCRDCVADGPRLQFESEVKAVYWKAYPLRFLSMLASAFLMPRGEHQLRVDLVNAATRQATPITTARVVSSSSCIVTPIHGRLMVTIPSPGICFVNVHVDGRQAGSMLIAAESDQPQYSYSLHDADIARVRAGELLILVKNSTRTNA